MSEGYPIPEGYHLSDETQARIRAGGHLPAVLFEGMLEQVSDETPDKPSSPDRDKDGTAPAG